MLGGARGHPGLGLRGWGKLDRDCGAPLCLARTSSALALRGDRSREKLAHVASPTVVVRGEAAASRTFLESPKPQLLSSSVQWEDGGKGGVRDRNDLDSSSAPAPLWSVPSLALRLLSVSNGSVPTLLDYKTTGDRVIGSGSPGDSGCYSWPQKPALPLRRKGA